VAPQNSRVRQLAFALGHSPSHVESDFIVGDSNRLAYQHIAAWPEWSGPFTLITGPSHSGKSHLAAIWSARAKAETATPESLAALAVRGGGSPILLEDADRIPHVEAELFGMLNQCLRAGRSLLMTARTDPSAWPYATADVLSRVRLAAHFRLEPPGDIELSQMFVKLCADRQLQIEPKVVSYLVTRMERSHEMAVLLVALMDEMALAQGAAITRRIAADALEQLEMEPGLFDQDRN
jgi:chromosomal replication initiation ATPase DnaA